MLEPPCTKSTGLGGEEKRGSVAYHFLSAYINLQKQCGIVSQGNAGGHSRGGVKHMTTILRVAFNGRSLSLQCPTRKLFLYKSQ